MITGHPAVRFLSLLNASLALGIAVTPCTQEPHPREKIHFPSQTNAKLME